MIPTILFRADSDNTEEFDILKYTKFKVITQRSQVIAGDFIIGRYSVLPYYKELMEDIVFNGGELVNSHAQHLWISNFFGYYEVLKDYTFQTWRSNELPYVDYDGAYVVKGVTNSKKHKWNTHMFAENRRKAIEIGIELQSDMLLASQDVIYRKFDPDLKVFEVGVNGMRFTNEWRVFCYKGKILSTGYYWTCAKDADTINDAGLSQRGLDFVSKMAEMVVDYVNFYVIDIAERNDGSWVVVEINDGQMSGLSMNNMKTLYDNLYEAAKNH